MNHLDSRGLESTENRILGNLQRLASSFWLGVALAAVAGIFVYFSWRSVDFESLQSVPAQYLIAAGVSYGLALMTMAFYPQRTEGDSQLMQATMSAHLLKYVPGSIWQGQRLHAVGGMSAVFTFALGVLAAAGLGLAVSGRLISVVLGVGAFVTAIGVAWRAWGMKVAIRVGLLSLLVMAFVAVSGALVGAGAGLGAAWAAREIAGAWGLGVLVLPVPAGLGIRELFLSLSEIPAASAQLGLVHRVVTLAVDVLVGGVGFMLAARRR